MIGYAPISMGVGYGWYLGVSWECTLTHLSALVEAFQLEEVHDR